MKTVLHYTHFIFPFIVSKNKYEGFMGKLISEDTNWELQIDTFDEKINAYTYFLPYVKKMLFPTLYWKNDFRTKFGRSSTSYKAKVLSNLPGVNFRFRLEEVCERVCSFNSPGINFKVGDIRLYAFEPGICFMDIKACIDKEGDILTDDVLDFNYKFRTINPRYQKKKKTEGIFIKNLQFETIEDLSILMESLLNGFEEENKEDIYFDRLFTYSFMCLDEKEWNEDCQLDAIINEFYKFQYVLPGKYDSIFEPSYRLQKDNTYTRWKYSVYGFTREAGVLFASEKDSFNKDRLPYHYESIYFFIFLLAFYQRIALIMFSEDIMTSGAHKIGNLKAQLTKFIHFSWFSQITNSEHGMDLWKKWQKTFDLPALFEEVHKEYNEFYEQIVSHGQQRINLLLVVIFVFSAVFAAVPLLIGFNIIGKDNQFIIALVEAMLGSAILIYPVFYLVTLIKRLFRKNKKNSLWQ